MPYFSLKFSAVILRHGYCWFSWLDVERDCRLSIAFAGWYRVLYRRYTYRRLLYKVHADDIRASILQSAYFSGFITPFAITSHGTSPSAISIDIISRAALSALTLALDALAARSRSDFCFLSCWTFHFGRRASASFWRHNTSLRYAQSTLKHWLASFFSCFRCHIAAIIFRYLKFQFPRFQATMHSCKMWRSWYYFERAFSILRKFPHHAFATLSLMPQPWSRPHRLYYAITTPLNNATTVALSISSRLICFDFDDGQPHFHFSARRFWWYTSAKYTPVNYAFYLSLLRYIIRYDGRFDSFSFMSQCRCNTILMPRSSSIYSALKGHCFR